MKRKLMLGLSLAGLFLLAGPGAAFAEEKEVEIKGEGQCAKCSLKKTDACQNAIVEKKDGKEVVYYLEKNKVSNDFHKNLCSGKKQVKAKGKVEEKDGKKILTVTSIDLVEKK